MSNNSTLSLPTATSTLPDNERGISLPFLQRNIRYRYRKLTENKHLQDQLYSGAKPLSGSISTIAVNVNGILESGTIGLTTTPFLKRNLCIQRITSSKWRRKVDTTITATTGSTGRSDSSQQYRVHCMKQERNATVITLMASYLCQSFHCPFCDCDYSGTDFKQLWIHCTLNHGDQHVFHPIQTRDRAIHLLVQPQPQQQQQQQQPLTPNGDVVDGRIKTDLLFCKRFPSHCSIQSMPSFHKAFQKNVPLPIRPYYHDVTFHPIGVTEWLCRRNMNDTDDNDEYDPLWRRIVDTSALYDLTDVASKDKLFMLMWNDYMRNNPIRLAATLPLHLKSFVRAQSIPISEHELRDEFMIHITNMWVEGHISRETVLDCMKIYNTIVKGELENNMCVSL